MFLKPELTALIQSVKVLNPKFLEVTDFVLHERYNQPSNENTPGNSCYAMLFVKKGKKKKFNNTKYLPPDQHFLIMNILCCSFVENSM